MGPKLHLLIGDLRRALNQINGMQKTALDFMSAISKRGTEGSVKKEEEATEAYKKGIGKMREYLATLTKDNAPTDHKTEEVVRKLQTSIIAHESTLRHGHFKPVYYHTALQHELKQLYATENKDNYAQHSILKKNLERELFGQTMGERSQKINQQRDAIYAMDEKIKKLPDNDLEKLKIRNEMQTAISSYGADKAKFFLDQLMLSGKNNNQRDQYITKKNQSLNTSVGYQTDPFAKQLLQAECDNYPKANKQSFESFVSKVEKSIDYDAINGKDADAHYSDREQFKKFLEDKLGPGFKVEPITSYNNVLFKITDGSHTVVAKLGVYANRLTDTGADYPAALGKMKDKSHFGEVYNQLQPKKNGNDSLVFELGKYMPGENMGSYFKKQDTSTPEGILQRQANTCTALTGIIDMLEKLGTDKTIYTDLKCGNFIRDENGLFKIADMKSLLHRGDRPDSDFKPSDVAVTFMDNSCRRETLNGVAHYDLDHLVKTALAAQLVEMLTLSQDAGTSPYVSFGKMTINWDQAVLKEGIGKEVKALYDKLTTDPNFTLAKAKTEVAELQNKIVTLQDKKVSEVSNNSVDQKQLNGLSVKVDEMKTDIQLTTLSEEKKQQIDNLVKRVEKIEIKDKKSPSAIQLGAIRKLINQFEKNASPEEQKQTQSKPKPTLEDRSHAQFLRASHQEEKMLQPPKTEGPTLPKARN